MKQFILFAFLSVALVSCSDDSTSDVQDDSAPVMTDPTDGGTTTKISFATDIKPMITAKCTPCHVSGGSQTDYSSFANASSRASSIQNRVNRTQGSSGFMPQGGTKLSSADLAKIDQWITDGKLE